MSLDTPPPAFGSMKKDDTPRSLLPWLVASGVIALLLVVAVLTFHRKTVVSGALMRLDPYAASLSFSRIQMSESASLSGAKVTYIDGLVRNDGTRTISGAELQVLFPNDLQQPPQLEAVPLTLIRTHEPYIDTEPLGAAPLAPGAEHEFRLAFENIATKWNQAIPEIHVVAVETK